MNTYTQLKVYFTFIFSFYFIHTFSQFSIDITYYDNTEPDAGLYGFHTAYFFDHCRCYDPWTPGPKVDSIEQCMQYAAGLKPMVLRFPGGGLNKTVHLEDGPG